MKCLNPVNIKNPLYTVSNIYDVSPFLLVPCGRCICCRINKRREWSLRIVHESSKYVLNSFVTLTYDDNHLIDMNLHKEHLQGFLKRFRYYVSPVKIRYYASAEYGEVSLRPHYHLIIFNWFPADDDIIEIGKKLSSKTIKLAWPYGFNTVGFVTLDSANYVAGYVEKKLISRSKKFYDDGRPSEFALMSRRPGIGVISPNDTNKDYFILKGRKFAIPRYYKEHYKKDFGIDFSSKALEFYKKFDKLNYEQYKKNVLAKLKIFHKYKMEV